MNGGGLRDVVAVESGISAIVDDELTYRGIPIGELFERSNYEEVTYLLWFGRLPSAAELAGFRQRLAAASGLPEVAHRLVEAAAAGGPSRALEAAVLGLSLAADGDPIAWGVRLLTGLPLAVAAFERLRHGLEPVVVAAPGSGAIAGDFLAAWRASAAQEWEMRALHRSLLLVADHELNASTFAARVAASTGADLGAAVLAGVATYSGPLHGGAAQFTGELLTAASSETAAAEVARRLGRGERIPGFGHAVYRRGDPRVPLFRMLAEELAVHTGDGRHLATADRLAEVVTERTGRAANMDLYAAACWLSLGIPPDLFPAIFAIGRMAGWVAHVLEQAGDNRLIRPRARYVGPERRVYLPIGERGR